MMTDNTDTNQKYGKMSFADGYWFHFEDGENDITVNTKAMTKKERIYLNDELMSQGYGFSSSREYRFIKDGANYIVRFKILNVFTSNLECRVWKDGDLLGVKQISAYDGSPKEVLKRVWPFSALGFLFGAGGVALGLNGGSPHFLYGMAVGVVSVGVVTFFAVLLKSKGKKS